MSNGTVLILFTTNSDWPMGVHMALISWAMPLCKRKGAGINHMCTVGCGILQLITQRFHSIPPLYLALIATYSRCALVPLLIMAEMLCQVCLSRSATTRVIACCSGLTCSPDPSGSFSETTLNSVLPKVHCQVYEHTLLTEIHPFLSVLLHSDGK